jgi:hypothetical protein
MQVMSLLSAADGLTSVTLLLKSELLKEARVGYNRRPLPVAALCKAWDFGRPLAGIRREHGCLSVVSALFCQEEISATG